jgi:para-nitrobenzyl esterase
MNNLHLVKTFAWTPEDLEVSKTMHRYFANFIKTGNPNGDGQPDWPAAKRDEPAPPVMVIDVKSGVERAKGEGRYEWMDRGRE